MRLFVAIEIAPEIRDLITQFISQIEPSIANARWSRPEGLHITLKFLGNVPDEKRNVIEEKLRGMSAAQFSLSLSDVGVFPNAKAPRVLWVGVDGSAALSKLAEQIDVALAPLGFEREKRAFTPHVTLARFNDRAKKAGLSAALSSAPKIGFGTMTATEFYLYESKLSPTGSQYNKLAGFALEI